MPVTTTDENSAQKPTPLYRQIREHLLSLIKSGDLTAGDRLPTEKALAEKFGVARATVVSAMQPLVQSGQIVREVGRGTFVGSSFIDTTIASPVLQSLEEQLAQQGAPVSYRFASMDRISADCHAGRELGLDASDEMYRLVRVRLSGKTAISLEARHLCSALGRQLLATSLQEKSFIAMLNEDLGIAVDRISGVIFTSGATEDEAAMLDIKAKEPLLRREFVIRSEDGKPISHGIASYISTVRFTYSGGGSKL